ncbi:helix-turn-helix domain-containing protein [Dactylosporangium matsuzakiense]|nr:helix-turn-helix transcriptional regulator [Dactylosporangium matsuzakiense]UWZ50184.1 helix-turn-helix transcriptional regulator [Dactylosporangium matsuzakiense]
MQAQPDLTVGEKVKFYRQRSGKSRAVVAGLVGRSAEWVKAVESGRLLPPRLPMLNRLAAAVNVTVKDLLEDADAPGEMLTGPGHSGLSAVREAMNTFTTLDAPAQPLDHLAARLAAAWRARHASPDHRTVLAALLPDLLRDAQHAVRVLDGASRRRASALLAEVHVLAQMYLAYQLPANDLLWRSADRAMLAAQESGDPRAIAGATWAHAQAHRDSGDWDAAMQVNLDGLDLIERHLADGDVELLSLFGALQFEAAFTAARTGEGGTALRYLDVAEHVAERLPDGHYQPWTSFSKVIMGAHAVTVAVELRQPGEALRAARRTAASSIPSRPRRARHLVEVARGHHMRHQPAATLDSLAKAFVAAPETVRYNGYARQMTLDLLDGAGEFRPAARDLAAQLGLPT